MYVEPVIFCRSIHLKFLKEADGIKEHIHFVFGQMGTSFSSHSFMSYCLTCPSAYHTSCFSSCLIMSIMLWRNLLSRASKWWMSEVSGRILVKKWSFLFVGLFSFLIALNDEKKLSIDEERTIGEMTCRGHLVCRGTLLSNAILLTK